MKIAALVVAYGDSKAVMKCIHALLCQTYVLDAVIVVDNTNPPLPELSQIDNNRLLIIGNNKNLGVAKALNIGYMQAINLNCDWCWTFDQDSEPFPNALEELVKGLNNIQIQSCLIGIISSTGISRKFSSIYRGNHAKWLRLFSKPHLNRTVYKCDVVLTAGSLVNMSYVANYGGANDALFIDWVDFDFCINIINNNYNIFCCQTSFYYHQIGGDTEYAQNISHAAVISKVRAYYLIRNSTITILITSNGILKYLYYPFHIARLYINLTIPGKAKIFVSAIADGLMRQISDKIVGSYRC